MDSSTKIIIGLALTVLMTLFAHHIFGTGTSFVDGLEAKARDQIAQSDVNGVNVTFESDPAVTRTAILSGDIPENKRDELIAMVKNIEGVGEARWADDTADDQGDDENNISTDNANTALVSDAESEAKPTADTAISKCQSDINAVMADKKINFNSGSAYVGPRNLRLIDEIVEALKPCSELRLEIQGHTDLIGSDTINKAVSEARAQSVKTILVERGLNADNIVAKGYGATSPIEKAKTSAANEKNRRTVFVIESIDK